MTSRSCRRVQGGAGGWSVFRLYRNHPTVPYGLAIFNPQKDVARLPFRPIPPMKAEPGKFEKMKASKNKLVLKFIVVLGVWIASRYLLSCE